MRRNDHPFLSGQEPAFAVGLQVFALRTYREPKLRQATLPRPNLEHRIRRTIHSVRLFAAGLGHWNISGISGQDNLEGLRERP